MSDASGETTGNASCSSWPLLFLFEVVGFFFLSSHMVFSVVISNTGECDAGKLLTAWLALVTSFSFMLMLGSHLKRKNKTFFL